MIFLNPPSYDFSFNTSFPDLFFLYSPASFSCEVIKINDFVAMDTYFSIECIQFPNFIRLKLSVKLLFSRKLSMFFTSFWIVLKRKTVKKDAHTIWNYEKGCTTSSVAFLSLQYSPYEISGNYGRAMQTYKEIHQKFPENLDCKF